MHRSHVGIRIAAQAEDNHSSTATAEEQETDDTILTPRLGPSKSVKVAAQNLLDVGTITSEE